jgi:hypothetical protein
MSIVGISKRTVGKIANGVHTSQLPRKPRKAASSRCPICGAVDTEGIHLHGGKKARYLVVRAKVKRQVALGDREALSAVEDGYRDFGRRPLFGK